MFTFRKQRPLTPYVFRSNTALLSLPHAWCLKLCCPIIIVTYFIIKSGNRFASAPVLFRDECSAWIQRRKRFSVFRLYWLLFSLFLRDSHQQAPCVGLQKPEPLQTFQAGLPPGRLSQGEEEWVELMKCHRVWVMMLRKVSQAGLSTWWSSWLSDTTRWVFLSCQLIT